ncbi:hypothetical protein FRC12_009963 [Ceratobasidium sp. 428]|nr:hypothetical protein FRC12_009963 [Ceratobasidium sp. 428]
MAVPPANTNVGRKFISDGLSVGSPLPESYMFPTESDQRYPQTRSPQVLRALDSFAFIVNGRLAPLPPDWYKAQQWHNIRVVGAAAPLCGPEMLSVQLGWFSIVKWCWIFTETIDRLIIKSDNRYRKGELCFWLVTKRAEYVVYGPHMGYSRSWETSLQCLAGMEPGIPRFRRCKTQDPVPPWWDTSSMDLWTSLAQRSEVGIEAQILKKRLAHTPSKEAESANSAPAVQGKRMDESISGATNKSAAMSDRARMFDPNNSLGMLAQVAWDEDENRAERGRDAMQECQGEQS